MAARPRTGIRFGAAAAGCGRRSRWRRRSEQQTTLLDALTRHAAV
ncbi:hypothetical protein [Kitasatospora cathayae]|uniref:Uncharacterized protein n=1 Tax=Kitasatospora cathayae TaxID=3004092 RepID=A0ABY7QG51_9ACTN|nr:hypothetical protein [Kitasatospora sp. HUAS 3-15]WBP91239.1 hypothetical protein O1G21_38750 [Kitasatospora sp. HUAS 3-15]